MVLFTGAGASSSIKELISIIVSPATDNGLTTMQPGCLSLARFQLFEWQAL
jgi:hypothetical protein